MGNQSNEKSFSLLKKISRKKIKGSILRYAITVFSCVLIIVMGAGILAYASATTIGENIITNILTATGLTVSGNATTTGTLNAEGGIIGNLTGNVTGDLTGTSTNATKLANILAADYSTEAERNLALENYLALTGGTVLGDLTVSGTTALATTTMATTTISGNLTAKTGRTATFVIAASNSLATSKAQADYVCDGVDDQVQIQAAIDALPDNGGKILLLEGIYNAGDIFLNGESGTKNNVTFMGSGWSTVIRHPNMTRNNTLQADGISGLLIANLQIDGNYANQNMTEWAMKYGPSGEGGPNSCVATVCEIYLNNIFITNSNRVTVKNVYSHSATHNAILFQAGTEKSTVKDCYIRDCQWHGIEYWMGGHYSSIIGNHTENCYKSPIVVELGAPFDMHVIVSGNVVQDDGTNCECGIRIQTCSHVGLIGNIVYNQKILIAGADHVVVSNNVIDNNYRAHGIHSIGHYNIIQGNNIYNTFYDAIYIAGNNSIVSNNIIRKVRSGRYCIQESSGYNYNDIKDNSCFEIDASPAISTVGANTKVIGNRGYVTESSGNTTIASGDTYINVTHNLAITPSINNIAVVPTNNLGGAVQFWISDIGADTFRINVDTDPGATTATFAWQIGSY